MFHLILALQVGLSLFNSNPIQLDPSGKAFLYLQPREVYTIILYAPGVGHSCLGRSVGAELWRVNNLVEMSKYPLASHHVYDDNTPTASQFLMKDGHPASGAFVCTYKSGTTIPLATYREPFPPVMFTASPLRYY